MLVLFIAGMIALWAFTRWAITGPHMLRNGLALIGVILAISALSEWRLVRWYYWIEPRQKLRRWLSRR